MPHLHNDSTHQWQQIKPPLVVGGSMQQPRTVQTSKIRHFPRGRRLSKRAITPDKLNPHNQLTSIRQPKTMAKKTRAGDSTEEEPSTRERTILLAVMGSTSSFLGNLKLDPVSAISRIPRRGDLLPTRRRTNPHLGGFWGPVPANSAAVKVIHHFFVDVL